MYNKSEARRLESMMPLAAGRPVFTGLARDQMYNIATSGHILPHTMFFSCLDGLCI